MEKREEEREREEKRESSTCVTRSAHRIGRVEDEREEGPGW
jgi:hypothetical protein